MGKKDTSGKDLMKRPAAFPNYAAEVINNFCTLDIPEEEFEKEAIDMCKAVRDMKAEERAAGEAKGRTEGELLGSVKAYYDAGWEISRIAKKCNISEEKVIEILKDSKLIK